MTANLCRVCLKIKAENVSIFVYKGDKYLPAVIYNISGVKVSQNVEPEAKICKQCATAVISAQDIILRCQEADEYLDSDLNHSANHADDGDYNCDDSQCEDTEEMCQFSEDVKIKLEANVASVALKPTIIRRRQRTRDSTKTPIFNCDLCDFNAKTGKSLIAHKRDEHQIDDPNIYSCTLCNQRFSWKPTLYRHIQMDHKTVPDDKKFHCNECGKAYTREVHLIEHRKQRHGPRRFKCADPDCEQTFTRAFTLRRHYLAAHTTSTPYHCADCDKYFKIYDIWMYHNKVVHKNKTVYCPRCGYPFRFKDKLEEHLEKNVCKRSIVPCPYCQRRFTAKAGLKEHLKKIHQIKEPCE